MLRHARAHARAEACGHHDCCELRLVHSAIDGWGARIRTWDHGTKTRCLTTWPRPSESVSIGGRCRAEPGQFAIPRRRSNASATLNRSGEPRRSLRTEAPALPAAAAASSSKSPYTAGPAPLTSARKAPSRSSSVASGEETRSFRGSAARSAGVSVPSSAETHRVPAGLEPGGAASLVEPSVDGRRRLLAFSVRKHEDDPDVARQGDRGRAPSRLRSRAAPRPRGRTGRRRRWSRRGRAARSCESGSPLSSFASLSAVPASELPPPRPAAIGMRLSIRTDQPWSAPVASENAVSAARTIVSSNPSTTTPGSDEASTAIVSQTPIALEHGDNLVLSVGSHRADDERRG